MTYLRIALDKETYERLQERALAERRPTPWQAVVELRQALGLPFPYVRRGIPTQQQESPSEAQRASA